MMINENICKWCDRWLEDATGLYGACELFDEYFPWDHECLNFK